MKILLPVLIFIGLGLLMGALLALASKLFAVKKDEKAEAIKECLPGANCGGCGYSGCDAYAAAVSAGDAPVNKCSVGGAEAASKIAQIMGVDAGEQVRMRAQVMCSGTGEYAKKKYIYEGIDDCVAASKIGGGDKMCKNGCIGLGTCVRACPFDAIVVEDGVAAVDYSKCKGCGICVSACPKGIIKLIPFDAKHWVGCMSVDDGKNTRKVCDVGCISCKLCQKNCPAGAINVDNFVASIDYDKCTGCDICTDKCPRHIIWSGEVQGKLGLVIKRVGKS
ncbi:MAG: Fe-S cluster domain-containing protein [Eubacteriales bacterium]|nr:Fe-S cluster domain-containing protein [Clostridia bacterium]MDY2844671.1 Fe-S cluster domain-containing protein [Eubacteriales bacterium]